MKKIYLLTMLLLSFTYNSNAQDNTGHEKRLEAISTVVKGYNQQDFTLMQKPLFLIGKTLVTNKRLREEFVPFYQLYGKAIIDTVTYTSRYSYVAALNFEKDSSKRAFFNFMFNENEKVEGFGFGPPTLIYPKVQPTADTNLASEAAKFGRIETLIKEHLNRDLEPNFNGCVLALDKGRAVYKNCFGYADYTSKELLNDSTLFDLASCSKQFTAMAIMLLEEQGKLNYSDTLQKFLPELPYPNITIENLLTHTSGLPDYERLMKKHWDKARIATNYDIIPLFKAHDIPTHFAPNQRFEYSNTGYALLAIIVERASGMMYPEFIETTIFEPLNMQRTRVYNTRRSKGEAVENYALGYIGANDVKKKYRSNNQPYVLPDLVPEFQHVVYLEAIFGDGAINSTVSDLALWDQALRENKLVRPETLQRAYSKQVLANGKKVNYGFGVSIREGVGTERVIYHTGGWPGYFSIIMQFPDLQKTVVILSNNSYNDFMNLADEIAVVLME